jgi:hypothetical protein
MIIISHRGNLDGRNLECENNPTYIQQALDQGYDVEVDVWYIDDRFFLGHDTPTYLVEPSWFERKALWCHAKNIEAFEKMLELKIHCFWHENDKYTLTNKGIPWCFPENYHTKGITVILDKNTIPPKNIGGICTDYPLYYSKLLNQL